jgi:transglutaminase-like putative cysteine protease
MLLVCLVCLLGVTAVSAAATTEEIPFEMVTFINPYYADVITEEDLTPMSAVPMTVSEEYFTTKEAAAAELARQMAARNESIFIHYQSPVQEEDISGELYEMAIAHTGIPGHGDNLTRQFGGGFIGISGYIENGVYYYTAIYDFIYYTTAEQEAELDTAVDELLVSLDLEGKTDLQKVKTIYDWICDNVTYDYAGLEDDSDELEYTAYDALVNKSAVCQGYANLLYRLLLEEGIDCRMVCGDTPSGRHAWNIIQVGDLYY